MRRVLLLLLASTALAASSGCCCFERWAIYGLCGSTGPWGPYYGNEGPYNGPAPRGQCGYCSNCGEVGRRDYDQEPEPLETGDAEHGAEIPSDPGLDDGLYDGQRPTPAESDASTVEPQAVRERPFYLQDLFARRRSVPQADFSDHYQVDYESVERPPPRRSIRSTMRVE
jgi:hypothetical protein